MGRASPGGQSLGNAQGRLSIDVSDLSKIQAATQQAGQAAARNLGQIDTAAKRTQASTTGLANSMGNLVGAFGIATGAAALTAQLARMALQADAVATAYRRQSVAALSLAGSQDKLNELLATYDRVTGGTIDKALALADVTRLQAVGFADDAAELKEFTIAARGISVAMGAQQDYVIGQLQLAIANQSTMRLDQIGLGVVEVTQRIKDLKAADSTLSTEMAYQNAVLGIATEKYGKLAGSLEAQATGAEKAAKAWKDLQLQFGETAGPAVSTIMESLSKQLEAFALNLRKAAVDAEYLKKVTSDQGWTMPKWFTTAINADLSGGLAGKSVEQTVLEGQVRARQNQASYLSNNIAGLRASGGPASVIADQEAGLRQVNAELAQFRVQLALANGKLAPSLFGGAPDIRGRDGYLPRAVPGAGPSYTDDQTEAIRNWAQDVKAIEREAGAARLETTRQYEQQRTEAIASYGKSVLREEQDFARNRARAITDQARAIADVQEDAAKREADAAKDYARAVARTQEDAAKRAAKWQEDYNERVAEIREAGNERLTELEADYAKNRERAASDHRDRLMDAAGRLDAVAVREEQKNYARQQQEAKENYDDQRSDIQKALGRQLADALEAQEERLADAREADRERLADMQEAFEEQRAEARQADIDRLEDMKAAFDERLAREDEERAISNQRRDEDYADQLAQLDRANAERLAKIDEQAAKEKASLEQAFLEQLNDLGLHNADWLALQRTRQARSLALFEQFWAGIEERMKPVIQGPLPQTGWLTDFNGGTAPIVSGGGSSGGGGSRTVNINEGSIVIYGTAGQSESDIARLVRDELIELLEGAQ